MNVIKSEELKLFFDRDAERQLGYLKHPLHKFKKIMEWFLENGRNWIWEQTYKKN